MNDSVRVAIVGGGITGLAAALRLAAAPDVSVALLESDNRAGGKILTERVNGLVIEGGPDCFLGMKPDGMGLVRELGLEPRICETNPAFRRTYVRRRGRLHELPEGLSGLVPSRLWPLLGTGLLSPLGRLRAGLELLMPRALDDDESIASFVTRRFGCEAYDWLVEPLLSGIYAGDGTRLSLAATFPQLVQLERERRSVLWAMMRNARAGRGARPAGPGFVTLAGGLGEIVETAVRRLPAGTLRTGARVSGLERVHGGYRLALDRGGVIHADSVILATPAYVSAALLKPIASGLAAELDAIPYVSAATISLAYPSAAVPRPLDGYGYVSPRAEGGPIVACTWTSNKFPGRVPEGQVLVRFFVGRAGQDEIVQADDATLLDLVRTEMDRLSGVTAEPVLTRVFRWPRGIPQYHVGHRARLDRIDHQLVLLPGLALAGNAYRGIGVPDCITQGRAAADRVLGVRHAAAA